MREKTFFKYGLAAVLVCTGLFLLVWEFFPALVLAPYNRLTLVKKHSMGQTILDQHMPEYREADAASKVCFKQVELDSDYHTEGASVADINNDGLKDIVTGHYWYQAPKWQRHVIRKPKFQATIVPKLSDYIKSYLAGAGKNGVWMTSYPLAFFTFHQDVNQDGWIDTIAVDITSRGGYWFENPKGKGAWKEHVLMSFSRNESPLFIDLLNLGAPQVITGHSASRTEGGRLEAIQVRPAGSSISHVIEVENEIGNNGSTIGSHGLGVGDVNGDGLSDVIFGPGVGAATGGWYEQKVTDTGVRFWQKHVITPMVDASQIHVMDINDDGRADFVAGSSHQRGLFWFEQGQGNIWQPHVIDDSYTQIHASAVADIDGDGVKDIIAGKTYMAHFGLLDEDEFGKPVLYWYKKIDDQKDGTRFIRHLISDKVGVGRQITAEDINGDGLLDVAVGNRNGVHIFLQSRNATGADCG